MERSIPLKPTPRKRSRRSRCRARWGYYVEQTVRGVRYGRIVCYHPHRRTLESVGPVWVEEQGLRAQLYDNPESHGVSQGRISEAKKKWKCPESREDYKLRLARQQVREIEKQVALEEKVRNGQIV